MEQSKIIDMLETYHLSKPMLQDMVEKIGFATQITRDILWAPRVIRPR